MSGLIDGVNKVFVVRHDGHSMHFEGHKTLNDAAMQLLRTDSWKPDWTERMEAFRKEFEHLVKYHDHDHVFKRGACDEPVCECGAVGEGWFCPKNPTGICAYENGNPDQCDHCGLPEERK